jgi:hypothetical protein
MTQRHEQSSRFLAVSSLIGATFFAWMAIMATAASPDATKRPKFTSAPGVDLSKPIIWGSECEAPNGQGLRFGGCDQGGDDGAARTQIKVDGQWKPIIEDLRGAYLLQKSHGQVRDASDRLRRLLACYRCVYFQGLAPKQQWASVAGTAELAKTLLEQSKESGRSRSECLSSNP